jgi:hypothetical protein
MKRTCISTIEMKKCTILELWSKGRRRLGMVGFGSCNQTLQYSKLTTKGETN